MADLFNKVLKMYPPLLHNFFLSTFTDPASWHNARLTFTQTSAVWCMVGHMLGLGDRHGENILMDTSTGACIHIDFACLFDKVFFAFAYPCSSLLLDTAAVHCFVYQGLSQTPQ